MIWTAAFCTAAMRTVPVNATCRGSVPGGVLRGAVRAR
jgi:hypothetical protein